MFGVCAVSALSGAWVGHDSLLCSELEPSELFTRLHMGARPPSTPSVCCCTPTTLLTASHNARHVLHFVQICERAPACALTAAKLCLLQATSLLSCHLSADLGVMRPPMHQCRPSCACCRTQLCSACCMPFARRVCSSATGEVTCARTAARLCLLHALQELSRRASPLPPVCRSESAVAACCGCTREATSQPLNTCLVCRSGSGVPGCASMAAGWGWTRSPPP